MISHEPIVWEGDEAERWAKVKPEPHQSIARLPPDYELLADKAHIIELLEAGSKIWRVTPKDTTEWAEFAVVEAADASDGCVVFARSNGRRWYCNPWSCRSLVMGLIREVEATHGNA